MLIEHSSERFYYAVLVRYKLIINNNKRTHALLSQSNFGVGSIKLCSKRSRFSSALVTVRLPLEYLSIYKTDCDLFIVVVRCVCAFFRFVLFIVNLFDLQINISIVPKCRS